MFDQIHTSYAAPIISQKAKINNKVKFVSNVRLLSSLVGVEFGYEAWCLNSHWYYFTLVRSVTTWHTWHTLYCQILNIIFILLVLHRNFNSKFQIPNYILRTEKRTELKMNKYLEGRDATCVLTDSVICCLEFQRSHINTDSHR